jgi:hypothetical protein
VASISACKDRVLVLVTPPGFTPNFSELLDLAFKNVILNYDSSLLDFDENLSSNPPLLDLQVAALDSI